jgi:hypothetical protein
LYTIIPPPPPPPTTLSCVSFLIAILPHPGDEGRIEFGILFIIRFSPAPSVLTVKYLFVCVVDDLFFKKLRV